jgi:hypothetical protein
MSNVHLFGKFIKANELNAKLENQKSNSNRIFTIGVAYK